MLARDFTLLYSFSVLKLPSIEVRALLGKKKSFLCLSFSYADLNNKQNLDEKLTNNRNDAQKLNLLEEVQVYKSHFLQCQSFVSV